MPIVMIFSNPFYKVLKKLRISVDCRGGAAGQSVARNSEEGCVTTSTIKATPPRY